MEWYLVRISSSTWHANLGYNTLGLGEVKHIFEISWVQLSCHIWKILSHGGCPILVLWLLQSFYPILSDVPQALCVCVML